MANTVDREIRITASDTGVSDRLSKLKEGALALGRGIAEDAKRQATSSRELIKLMNDEISLIEKKNKLNKESREMAASQKHSSGSLSAKTALKSDLNQISVESKEDKLQTDLLRQILQETIKTSTAEITADRESVKKKISSDKEIDTMEDHEEALKQTFQKQMIKDTAPKEDGSPSNADKAISTMGGFVKPGDMYSMGYGQASNMMHARAAKSEKGIGKTALAAGGLVLGAIGIGISSGSDYIEGEGDLARAMGGSPKGYGDLDKNLDVSTAQAMKRAAGLITTSGGTTTGAGELNKLMAVERGFGVNADILAKTGKFGQDASATEALGAARIIMTDKDTLQHRSRLQELLQLQLEMTEKQFLATGSGSVMTNSAIIHKIMSGQEVKSVGRARKTIGELDSMVQNGSEDLEALKFSEYQKKHGGTYFDYLREKEEGVSGEIDDIMVDKVLGSNQSKYDKQMSLLHMGLSPASIDDIMEAGGVTPEIKDKLAAQAQGAGNAAAAETTEGDVGINKVASSSAVTTNALALLGRGAVGLNDQFVRLTKALEGDALGAILGTSNKTPTEK
jgi:hypothetical protein